LSVNNQSGKPPALPGVYLIDYYAQFSQSGQMPEFGGPGLALKFARFPKPVIAAINGVAVGWGMTMPVACDIRLASPNARFAAPFVRVGLTPHTAVATFCNVSLGTDRRRTCFSVLAWLTLMKHWP
jgi:enoyl-CoA hydratase/carnithine racemase